MSGVYSPSYVTNNTYAANNTYTFKINSYGVGNGAGGTGGASITLSDCFAAGGTGAAYSFGDWQDTGRRWRPPPLEFNRYVNASDLLEEFIRFAGGLGADADQIMRLPVEMFVRWLLIRAAEADQEDPGDAIGPAELRAPQPRCLGCQRWMAKGTVVPLHGERCSTLWFGRQAA